MKIRLFAFSLLTLSFLLFGANNLGAQSSKINYTIHSNVINPDTLKGDQKAIFWHFKNESSNELKSMNADKLKAEFATLGLYPKDKDRFTEAYFFFVGNLTYHKKDCEMWEEFKYLKPDN